MLHKNENYNDRMTRLFPTGTELKINSGGCRQITFQVTEDCNLRCTYCYQINKTHNRMSLETAKRIVDCIFKDSNKLEGYYSIANINSIILEFIGGEPFLEIELIDKIMDYFLEQAYIYKSVLAYRYMISLCSNGVLYNTEKVQKFLNKWRNHISLTISLDGCKELHDKCRVDINGNGSYDLAEKATLQELKINNSLSTKMTLSPDNIVYFYDAIKNLINIGYRDIHCNCIFEEGWKEEHATLLYSQCKKVSDYLLNLDFEVCISFFDADACKPLDELDNRNWCGGSGLMLAANYKGEFYPCLRFMESSLGKGIEPYRIGDLDNGIGNLEKDAERVSCLDCITRRSQSADECFYCPVAKGCAWCTAYNYQEFGTPNKRATYICIMHKARALANCYHWNNYYRKNKMNRRFKLYLDDTECLKIIDKEELALLRNLEKED